MKWVLAFVTILVMAPASADEPTDAPLPLPLPPPQCAGVDPAASVAEVTIEGESRVAFSPLAASCLLVRLETLEADAKFRDDYYQDVLRIRARTQSTLADIHQRELAEMAASYEDALDDAANATTFWRYVSVGMGIVGVGAGATGAYFVLR